MAMMPKRLKYRKAQRGGRLREKATRGNTVVFGEYGLQSLGSGWMTGRQIEAGRMAASHFLHREGRVYIRVFPHKPVSAKPLETRMGKGKGELMDIHGILLVKGNGRQWWRIAWRMRRCDARWYGGAVIDRFASGAEAR